MLKEEILAKVAAGEINVEEATRLLRAIEPERKKRNRQFRQLTESGGLGSPSTISKRTFLGSREEINSQIRDEMSRIEYDVQKKQKRASELEEQIRSVRELKAPVGETVKAVGSTFMFLPFLLVGSFGPIGFVMILLAPDLGQGPALGIAVVGFIAFFAYLVKEMIQSSHDEWRDKQKQPMHKELTGVHRELAPLRLEYEELRSELKRPSISNKLRELIWIRDEKTCYLCGTAIDHWDGKNMHIDHFAPFSRGGTNNADNLRATHPGCNLKKRDKKIPPEVE